MYLGRRLALNTRQLVALIGGLHTLGSMDVGVNDPTMIPPAPGVVTPTSSVWTTNPASFTNSYFEQLLENDWACASWPSQKSKDDNEYWNCNRFEPVSAGKPAPVHVGDNYTLAMLPTDLALKFTPELAAIASEFIGPNGASSLFRMEFLTHGRR